jgi:hypothetical protein
LLRISVGALRFLTDEFLRHTGWNAKVDDAIFTREIVNFVFQVANPAGKFFAFGWRNAGGLVREVGANVAVDQDDLTLGESRFNFAFGFEAIAGLEQRGEMRIHGSQGAEFTVEKLADHFAEPGVVLRKSCGVDADARVIEGGGEQIELRALAAAVDTFNGDELAQSCGIRAGKQCDLDPNKENAPRRATVAS